MADIGSLARFARGQVLNAGAGYVALAYVGVTNHLRDLFNRANGTAVGSAPDQHMGGITWTGSTMSIVDQRLTSAAYAGSGIQTNNWISANSGVSDCYISFINICSGAPNTDANRAVAFRGDSSNNSLVSQTGWRLEFTTPGSATTLVTVYRGNGVGVAATSMGTYDLGTLAANTVLACEIRLAGPVIQIWCNGILMFDLNDSTWQTQTYVSLTVGYAVAKTVSYIDGFFVTDLPTCPGAIPDATFESLVSAVDLAPIAAGATIPAAVRWSRVGAALDAPNALNFVLQDDAGTVILSVNTIAIPDVGLIGKPVAGYGAAGNTATANTAAMGATVSLSPAATTTLHASKSTGLATGTTNVWGMWRFRFAIYDNDNGSTAQRWTIDTENGAALAPAGYTHDYGRGYFHASGTLISLTYPAQGTEWDFPEEAGAPTSLEKFTVGITVQDRPLRTTMLPTVLVVQSGTARNTGATTGSAWTLNGGNYVSTIEDYPRNTYLESESAVGWSVDLGTHSVFTGVPLGVLIGTPPANVRATGVYKHKLEWSTSGAAATEDAFIVDPRLFFFHHMQINDKVTHTPPDDATLASYVAEPHRMLATDISYLTSQVQNAGAAGVNGLTLSSAIADDDEQVDAIVDTMTTGTKGGEAGWMYLTVPGVSDWQVWGSSKPGGAWKRRPVITAPSAAVGLETVGNGASDVDGVYDPLALQAYDSSIGVLVAGGAATVAAEGNHWAPGEDLLLGLAVFDARTSNLVGPDEESEIVSPHIHVGRFRADTGVTEYLEVTYNVYGQVVSGSWSVLDPGDSPANIMTFPANIAVPGTGDSRVFVQTIPAAVNAGWDLINLFLVGHAYYDGTPYWASASVDVVGAANGHSQNYRLVTSGGPTVAEAADHWSPGMTFQAGLSVVDLTGGPDGADFGNLVPVDGWAQVALVRLNASGQAEFLKTDVGHASGFSWEAITTTADVIEFFAATHYGAYVYVKQWSGAITAYWGENDIFVLGRCRIGTREYGNTAKEIGVGAKNKHSAYKFDGAGFVGFPQR